MEITSIKTAKVTDKGDLSIFIDQYLPSIPENSIVVITSKIVSILEGNVRPTQEVDKKKLIAQEADQYIDNLDTSRYGVIITIKNNTLIASAGIDESNGNDHFILWPKNPFYTAATLWQHLRQRHHIKNMGVLITDSRITPMRWGTIGVGLAWCGFLPLKNYIGEPDIFGRNLKMTKASILDGLAAAAVLVMGEGSEQTPIAVISDAKFIQFTDHPPTPEEIAALQIEPQDDLFAPLLMAAPWQKH